MYAKFLKRVLDIFLSLLALTVLSPVLVVLMIVGAIAMKIVDFSRGDALSQLYLSDYVMRLKNEINNQEKSIVALGCLFCPNLISVHNWIKEVNLAEP